MTLTTVTKMRLVQTHMVYGIVLVTLHGKVKEQDSKAMELIVMVNNHIISIMGVTRNFMTCTIAWLQDHRITK